MKLSEMTLEQQAAAICDLCEPVGAMLEDARVGEALGKLATKPGESTTVGKMVGRFVRYVVPVLLRLHLAELVKIVSIMTGKSVKDVRAMGATGITKEVVGLMDGEMLDFFKSSADMERTKSQA